LGGCKKARFSRGERGAGKAFSPGPCSPPVLVDLDGFGGRLGGGDGALPLNSLGAKIWGKTPGKGNTGFFNGLPLRGLMGPGGRAGS